jgi:hypothetical protein
MKRIGMEQLRDKVAAAAEKYGLSLTLQSVSGEGPGLTMTRNDGMKHQVNLQQRQITRCGSPTQVAYDLDVWLDGFAIGMAVTCRKF